MPLMRAGPTSVRALAYLRTSANISLLLLGMCRRMRLRRDEQLKLRMRRGRRKLAFAIAVGQVPGRRLASTGAASAANHKPATIQEAPKADGRRPVATACTADLNAARSAARGAIFNASHVHGSSEGAHRHR
jgi:hypothetical protein